MELNQDFKELLQLLNDNQVNYIILGGYAVNQYGYPRYTQDIDLWVWMKRENAIKIIQTLHDYGFASMDIIEEDFLKRENLIQLGVAPNRIDIMTTVDGLKFEESYNHLNKVEFEGITLPFISLKDLIINKLATARAQDLADVENLKKINYKN